MDINNASNITTQQFSRINLNSATRAFEALKKEASKKEAEKTPAENFKQEDIDLIEEKIPQKLSKLPINVEEIQKYATDMGENLTIEDINYGLMYGRSVIIDYSA